MSIASELNALNGYILGAYDEINTKGGTVPANKNMANLASAIATISGGGGGGATAAYGSVSFPSYSTSMDIGSTFPSDNFMFMFGISTPQSSLSSSYIYFGYYIKKNGVITSKCFGNINVINEKTPTISGSTYRITATSSLDGPRYFHGSSYEWLLAEVS